MKPLGVKAGFLAAVAQCDTTPRWSPQKAIELLSTMQGGYKYSSAD